MAGNLLAGGGIEVFENKVNSYVKSLWDKVEAGEQLLIDDSKEDEQCCSYGLDPEIAREFRRTVVNLSSGQRQS